MSLQAALNTIGKEIVDEIKKNLLAEKKIATGSLYDSIDYQVTKDGSQFVLEIIADSYLTNVDEGRLPGKRPPTQAIEKWIKDKPIKSDLSDKSLAYVISKSIGEKGIPATHIIDKSINAVLQRSSDKLSDAYGEDILKEIQNIFK